MPTQRKVETVAELAERIGRSTLAVAASYLGLSVAEMGVLRRQLREAGGIVDDGFLRPHPHTYRTTTYHHR